ncbi:MAG TPA: DUF2007 domain-containing protein [Burkholderiaceae bacterium]|nr:DUF2007 domain-containing protein [Burkholderiaceae bacterium]
MKLLMRCDHLLHAQHVANVLRAAGIACELRNTALGGAIGDIPWLECAPQLWLRHAGDEPLARQLLDELKRAPDAAHWSCPRCAEWLEPQFATCWNCGAQRPTR